MPFVAGLLLFCCFLFSKPIFASPQVVINEFLPAPSSGNPEWVEFYASVEADLSNFYFDDDTDFNSDSGSSVKIALSGVLPEKTTCYWELQGYLNNNGDKPTLFKIDGSTEDTHPYTLTQTDKSYSRVPDGSDDWQINIVPTRSFVRCIDLTPAVIINQTSNPVQIVTQTQVTPAISPVFDWQLTEKAILGENFKINLNLKNFDKETEYYLKLRGGLDESHLTKMQTKNGGSYFSDNESWEKFPMIKTDNNGSWSGEIHGLVGEDKDGGTYKIKLRIRKKETETFSESEFKEIKITASVVVVNTPVATKSSVVVKEKSLVLGTKSAETKKETKPEIKPEVIPLQNKSFFPGVIVGVGMVLSALSILIWDIIRNKKDLWKKYLKIPGR